MIRFFKTTIWTMKLAEHSFLIRAIVKTVRIAILSFRYFMKNNCMLRASALTYYTLLSIIPVAALAFAIAKGFGLYARLETWLKHTLADKPEVAEKITEFASTMLDSAKGGIIAGFGAIALLIITIRLMMQIENEYGSYGNDHEYMRRIAEIYHDNGIDCLLYTSDGATYFMLNGGTLPEYPCVANFGSRPDENFKVLDDFRPNQPRMCGEYWCGWFDHWYDIHHVRDPKELAGLFKDMIDRGASLNFYMFHGGTNFGFMNGANYFDHYDPTVTSYDYNALLSEAGDLTPAYFEVRKMIEKSNGEELPPLTVKNSPKKAYGKVELTEKCDIFKAAKLLAKPVHTAAPKFMEDIGQYYGFTLYSTVLEGPREDWELNIDSVHDRAVIFVNHEYKGFIERTRHNDTIRIPLKKGETAQLDILCENMGRVNYGPKIMDRKGLRGIRFGLQYHFGWDMYPLPLTDLSALEFEKSEGGVKTASFLKGNLQIDEEPCDTFIKLDGFHKGIVIINGFNLGRYYNDAGPQKTLYVPAPVLKKGSNEVIVFETDRSSRRSVKFVDTPKLG